VKWPCRFTPFLFAEDVLFHQGNEDKTDTYDGKSGFEPLHFLKASFRTPVTGHEKRKILCVNIPNFWN